MQVELVTIGDELLLGFTIDTNAARIARVLSGLGVTISRRTTVGDDDDAITTAVADALRRADGVITTGGIGPTADDRTKQAVAAHFRRPLVLHVPTLAAIEARFRRRGFATPPANAKEQAMLPDGADLLENRHGSAPGIWIDTPDGKWVVMIPGVPREMYGLLVDEIVPRLRARMSGDATVVASRTVRTTGLPESTIADRVAHLPLPDGVSLAYLPSWEGVDLRVTIRNRPAHVAAERLETAVRVLQPPLGSAAYGVDDDDLAALVLDALRERHWTITAGESCTGGLLLERLTRIPRASDVVRGGVIAYDNQIKTDLLGVGSAVLSEHGAVSEPVAAAMAAGARRAAGADVGVGITGIAGPGGATPDKPVGTVCIAIEWPGGAESRTVHLPGDRAEVRLRATQAAFSLLVSQVRRTAH